ncbi:hypothetical protein CHGG_07974 [Chaetomium globosum CBS 148.51]|uniref:Chromo domain-containing protein n=1 Tax=Chaetomium globosum (strain ATCC 6205 / CBS 148.51 / DSM 1962 / NBRC 6347 / NRRL 1970) TaxID=306901 RepID=Q2GVN0_CHAGB|nr:uncharacterized protein CHGG_07974 [Chaetomium globosum CBS 148.51]EAQ86721.1 hypothetical protein CHGG_07974 [Chaetomium globosum CBS 148.51]
MSKIDPRASFGPDSPHDDESDDDISVTSTVTGHDPDQEFGVENILAQRLFEDGNMYYLVEWTDFPLWESTWEPESNIGADLKAIWEEDKAKHATGELKPFDVRRFEDAQKQAKSEKMARHRRRNRKRQRLGLKLTEPFDKDSSDEEAVEEAGIEAILPEPAQAARPQSQQKNTKEVSSSGVAVTPAPTPVVGSFQLPNEVKRTRGTAQELPTESSSAISTKRKQTAPPSPQNTGYQGTARPTRKVPADAVPKSKTRPTISIPTSARPITSNTRRTLTAKKSTTQPTGNIFTSGKTRKPRPSLKDTMSDPTREPKLFAKHRQVRQAYLRGRDKEDIAPDVSQLDLLDLRSKQTISRQNSGGSVLSPTQVLSPQQETPSPLEPPQTRMSALISPRSTLADSGAPRPKKKRKSVRFLDDDEDQSVIVQEPEQMDIDGPTIRESPQTFHPPPGRQRLSPDLGCWTPPIQSNQSSDKELVLGQSSVNVTFNGLPREPMDQRPWLSDFLAKKSLEFKHTCFSETAAARMSGLVQEQLASGTIVSKENERSLGRMSENLTAGLLALYYGQPEYNVLIYPTKCDEWKAILPGLQPASPSEETLGYFIFASSGNLGLVLPPTAPPPASRVGLGDSEIKSEYKGDVSARAVLIKRLFNFDYEKLLPRALLQRPPHEHAFFLAIPGSQREIGQALYHWLRSKNPECQVYTSHDAGSWDIFRSRAESIPGVLIIHEMLAWSLRRFPNLSRYLITRNDEYWCISEPVHNPPLYPSIAIPDYPTPSEGIQLARLFPYRTAILITPSFLVSEPRRSLEFFNWFSQWTGRLYYRLVTAYNIHEYLSELADERYLARKELLNSPSDMQFDVEANLHGLSREDCSCRREVASLAAGLHCERMIQAGPFAHDEDNSPVVYADSSIDPNDEQSLVNWFGWWATLRADQFRKFHVIGSSQTIKMPGCKRGERRVRIPKYSKVTFNEPDAVLEVIQERNDQVEASGVDTDRHDGSVQTVRPARGEHGFNQGRWAFRSNLIKVEDTACFAAYLNSLTSLNGSKAQWGLYKFPVSWLDLEMAGYFGDHSSRWRRISEWFKFTFPFAGCQGDGGPSKPLFGYNTYAGIFYAPSTRNGTHLTPSLHCYRRNATPGSLLHGRSTRILQQIQYVNIHGEEKKFDQPEEDAPMDLDSSSVSGDEDAGAEEDDNTRVIFHPPRGHRCPNSKFQVGGAFRSRCINRLYEEARLAKARAREGGDGSPPTHMRYAYVPTMDWYREQKTEGRAFAHVNVDSWEAVFGLLKIGAGKKEGGGADRSAPGSGGHSAGGGGGGGGCSDSGGGRGARESWAGSVVGGERVPVGSRIGIGFVSALEGVVREGKERKPALFWSTR